MQGRVEKASDDGYVKMLDGVERRTLVYGDSTLLAQFKLKGGYVLPAHSHPQEQTGYLVAGHIILSIAGAEHDIMPGDAWTVPGGAVHGANIIEDSLAVEVFSPIREDYIQR